MILRLLGKIQHYDWGGSEFLPHLLGFPSVPGQKYAEYWLGTHRAATSAVMLETGQKVPLGEFIAGSPTAILGATVAHQHGALPFLLKVLDVQQMLSIQVHPRAVLAKEGYARENDRGISLDSPSRNYRDSFHKPEIMVALSDFWLLYGFAPRTQTTAVLGGVPEFYELREVFERSGYIGVFRHVMELNPASVRTRLEPLLERIGRNYAKGLIPRFSPDFWAAKYASEHPNTYFDPGVFLLYLLNVVRVPKGKAIFQPPGLLHAYLEGRNVELMVSSDNVLRAGLTSKYVDASQVLKATVFEPTLALMAREKKGSSCFETIYESNASEFSLAKISLEKNGFYVNTAHAAEIIFLLSGEVLINGDSNILLCRGESVMVTAGTDYDITCLSNEAEVFRAFVPV
jgi:mannose-6-phosphate isomerase